MKQKRQVKPKHQSPPGKDKILTKLPLQGAPLPSETQNLDALDQDPIDPLLTDVHVSTTKALETSDPLQGAEPLEPLPLPPIESSNLREKDLINLYMKEIKKYPVLNREDEFRLAKFYYDTKDPKAAQALVTANLRFVVKVAAEYSKFGSRLIDLIQEGNLGLMHAIREFNPYKGVRLITYAVWWIRGFIQEYLMKQYSLVKIGTTQNQKKLFYNLQKEKETLDLLSSSPDNIKLLGSRLGVSSNEVQNMAQRLSGRDLSLDHPIGDNSSLSLKDLQKSVALPPDEDLSHRQEIHLLKENIESLRPHLSSREEYILDERLLSDAPLTLQEIGQKHGTTREAVRQMEERLINKIREHFLKSQNPTKDQSKNPPEKSKKNIK